MPNDDSSDESRLKSPPPRRTFTVGRELRMQGGSPRETKSTLNDYARFRKDREREI